jgi:DNA polymerase V
MLHCCINSQIQDLITRHQIQLFSSNFSYYGNMSSRLMATLEEFTPCLEVYIRGDEAFLDLTGVCHQDSMAYGGHKIRKTVLRSTGIPVCVGMGLTKVLAKLAGFGAKKIKNRNYALADNVKL